MRQPRALQGSVVAAVMVPAEASADVTGAEAGVAYTNAEKDLINEMKASLNDLKAKLRTAGVLLT